MFVVEFQFIEDCYKPREICHLTLMPILNQSHHMPHTRPGGGREGDLGSEINNLIMDMYSERRTHNLRIMDKLWCPKCRLPYRHF